MQEREELYFKNATEWRVWLEENHHTSKGVYLIFYKVSSAKESMRWEEAVKEALCFGWIDSTVKKLDDERRRQYFCQRNPKSVWSKLNKTYIVELIAENKMHESGSLKMIEAIKNGSWTALDDVENLIIPKALQEAFDNHPIAYENYQNFSPSYRKSYLYWLNQAKREATREKRITEIIRLCAENIKSRDTW
ncbi:YdeI/OmpD-associated family protein [Kordia sp. YSTF-M3]|uniref:YdeI/OmpD-associated family protein n=1 Tax=Kordia aestuariivivens TaxID=2759037 RepID=A0ABR7Q5N2_9FLAO|nr:YdeI/OmpD-associated family protein [Kordia aestuariivivens]MBC8753871.1 YdeI/OmpD-associated family protein [Kordia aestuariivivens]